MPYPYDLISTCEDILYKSEILLYILFEEFKMENEGNDERNERFVR